MAGKQQATKSMSGARAQKPGQSSPPSGTARSMSPTGERDEHYDLISVLYHALQGAETVGQYIRDAEQAGDDDLVEFLEETRDEHVERAKRAKQLLVSRMEGSGEAEEEEEDEEDEEED